MVSRGYIYIAFGRQYDKQCAHSAFQLRKHSQLSITVVTNLVRRAAKWQEVSDVTFVYKKATNDENRKFKTRAYKYTPYDETLLIDTDVLALRADVEDIFDYLTFHDIAFPYVLTYKEGPTPNIYKRAMVMFKCDYPLVVHQGGVCIFKQSRKVAAFFEKWHEAWKAFGRGREMQCLACMIQKSKDIHVGLLPKELYGNPKSIVLGHFYGKHHHKNLPRIRKNKPFNRSTDWVKV